jgi:hypothetical protein
MEREDLMVTRLNPYITFGGNAREAMELPVGVRRRARRQHLE